jgi:ornithine carbamoyltransferase
MAVDEPVAGNEPSPEEAREQGPADAPDPGSERGLAPSAADPADPWPAGPPRHFLTLDVLGPAGLRAVLDLAHRAKRDPAALRGQLAGGQIGLLFDKPSTRTRVSFEAAAWRLGILPIALRPDELQLGRGEPIPDTARVLSRYLEALVVRTFAQARLDELAAVATIPVLNALTDEHHPCQALADLMTLEEAWGSLAGATVAYVGDGNNVCHSLVQAAALAGFTLRVASPPGYAPDPAIVGAARRTAALTGARIEVTTDPRAAVEGADAVYTDVWASMGEEAEADARRAVFAPYQVNGALFALAARHAVFLHCLPAHRGEEVTSEVIDGPASRVWDQAENRLHTELAILYVVLTGDLHGRRLPV